MAVLGRRYFICSPITSLESVTWSKVVWSMKWWPPASEYRYSISRSSREAFSTRSVEPKRCSFIEPLRRLRIFAWTKPRRLPGVLWITSWIRCSSPLWMISIPLRICVAGIIMAPPPQKRRRNLAEGAVSGQLTAASRRSRLNRREELLPLDDPRPPRAGGDSRDVGGEEDRREARLRDAQFLRGVQGLDELIGDDSVSDRARVHAVVGEDPSGQEVLRYRDAADREPFHGDAIEDGMDVHQDRPVGGRRSRDGGVVAVDVRADAGDVIGVQDHPRGERRGRRERAMGQGGTRPSQLRGHTNPLSEQRRRQERHQRAGWKRTSQVGRDRLAREGGV